MIGINSKQFPKFIDITHYPQVDKVVMKQLELMEATQLEILIELRKMNSKDTLNIKDIGADLADDGKLNKSNRKKKTK